MVVSLLVVPTISLLLMASAPRSQPPTMGIQGRVTISRRAALGSLFLTPAAVFAADSDADLQCEDDDYACRDKQQKAIKERMKQRAKKSPAKRIEEAKQAARLQENSKPTDLLENRKKTVDYSCVLDSGSPC